MSATITELTEPPEVAALFGALAEPTRRQALRLAATREHTVGEIVERLGARQSAVSQHLKVLRDAGLVEVRIDGNRRLYRTRAEGFEPLYDFVRWLWPSRLQALKDVVEADPSSDGDGDGGGGGKGGDRP
jgi:DNA-binding transcriptional ArsR family regulator